MYRGRFEGTPHSEQPAPTRRRRRRRRNGRFTAMAAAAVLLLVLAIGGTVAWLSTKDRPITNKFLPSNVACEVQENFNGNVKTNVTVKNTGDIPAYIRVKLVTYRTNDQGQHIGGTAVLPNFTLGDGWVAHDGYYYYTQPVEPGHFPAANLTDSITLTGTYTDPDGGHQSIDVMAEAIQSVPAEAVGQAWGVSISWKNVTAYSGT